MVEMVRKTKTGNNNSRYNQVGYNEVPAYNEVVQWSGNPSIFITLLNFGYKEMDITKFRL